MGYSKEYMLNSMALHIEEMTDALKYAKIKEGHLAISEKALQLPVTMIREACHWIENLFQCEFHGYKKVRKLCTEEIWERYLSWEDFADHREVVLLRKAIFLLRKAVVSRQRPDFFKKGKVDAALKVKK